MVRGMPGGTRGLPNWVIGLVFIIGIIIASLLAFTKELPWRQAYEVQAVFESASNVRVNAPVRIAGVNVGKVTGVEHLTPESASDLEDGDVAATEQAEGAALVTMEISDAGRPIKTDSTFKMRPRLFLEGNLFVELHPGSPSAVEAGDNYVFSVENTSTTVQLDQILTTLQSDVRENLQIALEELGAGFIDFGGAEGFREVFETSPGAFKYSAQVTQAALGEKPHDLSSLIKNLGKVVGALGKNETVLADLVTNFRIFAGSFAAEDVALAEAVELLPGVLEAAEPALANLNAAFPPLRAFAREALPGVRSTPATLEVATPFIRQLALLVSPPELGGLVDDLGKAVPPLTELTKLTPIFLDETRSLSSCFNQVVIPWSNDEVDPPSNYPFPVAGNVYETTGYGLAGISGESRSGDANAQYIRTQAGGGVNLVHTGVSGVTGPNDLFGLTPFPIEAAIPSFSPVEDSKKTPFRPLQPCERQDPPNLGATLGTPPVQSTAAAPSADNLPPELAEAYSQFTGLLASLAEVAQLELDGDTEASEELEKVTLEALAQLLESYTAIAASASGATLEVPDLGDLSLAEAAAKTAELVEAAQAAAAGTDTEVDGEGEGERSGDQGAGASEAGGIGPEAAEGG